MHASAITADPVLGSNRRIRLGIWGLGRGMSFFKTCQALNLDVVAGCDFNPDLCQSFSAHNPGAFVTNDADAFLAQDFDAVLLATYAIGHADDAIRCLKAGKHVLSEVMAFFTPAQGVRLVEAVEQSGLVYQLAENYPFTPVNRYLARKWQEGLFGKLMYAEFGYLHEIRALCYTYLDGNPVQPGNSLHNWRSWINYHYYCTHSLGPVMYITGSRPTRVTALAGHNPLPGYVQGHNNGMGNIAPSLIQMSDGGVVRNLMGSTTDDGCAQRLWGTQGSAEIVNRQLLLRLGGAGASPKTRVNPDLAPLDLLARNTGHGGGDFWVLYHFAREILTGEKGPFDVYAASDVTLPGILACRSSFENGAPQDVPDFRLSHDRDRHRNDDWQQPRYDTHSVFPKEADSGLTSQFTQVMNNLCGYAEWVRAFVAWHAVASQIEEPHFLQDRVAEPLLSDFANVQTQYARARQLADAYPQSDGARVINEMLALGDEAAVINGSLLTQLASTTQALRSARGEAHTYLTPYTLSPLQPRTQPFDEMPYPDVAIAFGKPDAPLRTCLDLRPHGGADDGILYIRTTYHAQRDGRGILHIDASSAFKLWLNGQHVVTRANGASEDYAVAWREGENNITLAFDTAHGTTRIRLSDLWCHLRLKATEYV